MLLEYADNIDGGISLEDALTALTARGPGSNIIRADMANAFNAEAGYDDF
jgi:hypothetical protein